MWPSALVPIVATAIGTAIALGAERWRRVIEPVRSFALAAVTVTIAVHLMPEAVEAAGPWAIGLLAGGLLLPSLLGWAGAKLHAAVAVELGFAAVIIHQIGDGLALGVVGPGHWDFVLAIGAHTVPLAAVVALELGHGRARPVILRAIVIALAPLIGLGVVSAGATATAAPWLDAVVSGLLLHVLAHDLPTAAPRTPITRTIELAAIIAGAALPILTREAPVGLAARVPAVLGDLALAAAPALLAGIVLGAIVHVAAHRARVDWLAGGGGLVAALRGAVLGVPLPPCSCDIVPAAEGVRSRGAGAAFVVAFVLAAPELGSASVLLTAAMLGWQLALIRLAAAIAIAVVTGLVVERIAHDRGGAPAELPVGPRSIADGIDDRVAHDGSWILVGLTVAAFIAAAVPLGVLGGTRDLLVIVVLAPLVTVSATAATPIAAALVFTGLAPGAALAAVLLGSMLNLTTLGFLRRAWGTVAAIAAAACAIVLAVATAFAVDAAHLAPAPLVAHPGLGSKLALAALAALAAASLWRHGLAHWLTALRGSDHGHEHAPGEHDHHHEDHA